MVSKLSAQGSNQNRPFKPKIYPGKEEHKVEIIMIKADVDQTVEIDTIDHHIQVYLSTDKIIWKGLSMSKITEETLGEKILEKHKTRGDIF